MLIANMYTKRTFPYSNVVGVIPANSCSSHASRGCCQPMRGLESGGHFKRTKDLGEVLGTPPCEDVRRVCRIVRRYVGVSVCRWSKIHSGSGTIIGATSVIQWTRASTEQVSRKVLLAVR